MHYSNGSEAVHTVFKLPLSKPAFGSDNMATETCSIPQLACCTVYWVRCSIRVWRMWFRPPGKPLHPLTKPLSPDQGEHYASYHCVHGNRWKVYPKCARQLVFIVSTACVLETSLFLICAFLSTCEFLRCRALSVRDASSRRAAGPTAPHSYTGWVTASIPLFQNPVFIFVFGHCC